MTLRIERNGAVVIKEHKDGGNWFRVWSDGWIEQGGMYQQVDATAPVPFTINYLTPFSRAGDQMIIMTTFEKDAADSGTNLSVIARGTTYFQGLNVGYSRNPLFLSWCAFGY